MDNLIKINGREAHFIGVSKIKLGTNTYYDLSQQCHNPWFVLVLDSGEKTVINEKQEKITNGN